MWLETANRQCTGYENLEDLEMAFKPQSLRSASRRSVLDVLWSPSRWCPRCASTPEQSLSAWNRLLTCSWNPQSSVGSDGSLVVSEFAFYSNDPRFNKWSLRLQLNVVGVTQLVEWLPPTPEIRNPNQVISKFYILSTVLKRWTNFIYYQLYWKDEQIYILSTV